ncbi:hypothetical protein KBB17_03420 [Candidatus Saccharibacteria bacterium]|nr:hypothetical protein [Candidatus Saccharibacteria bacterium]MBP9131846.1 hypothetical protein [Candidatus Saccharibacteria bacterium]
MSVICPTITETTIDGYNKRIEKLGTYAERIHPDLTDDDFAPNKTINLAQLHWPKYLIVDLHVMYRYPARHLETVVGLNPHMMVFHAEAEGDLFKLIDDLQAAGVKAGVALLQDTTVKSKKELIEKADHVLVFSGKLGYHGGSVDFGQTSKVAQIKAINPSVEIGWDGGVSVKNAKELSYAGIDVLNAGGAIAHANDEQAAYQQLVDSIS